MGNPIATYNFQDARKSELTMISTCRPWARLDQPLL